MGHDNANRRLQELLARQDGLVRCDQLASAGVTRSALRWRVRTGRWRRLLPGVYLTSSGAITNGQRYLAAILYPGPGAVLTGAAALRCHGVRYVPKDPYVRVLVPTKRQVKSVDYVKVHRTGRPEPRPPRFGFVPVSRAARAVGDAARLCTDLREIRALIADVVQRRIVSISALSAELRQGPRAKSALLRSVVGEVGQGVRSAPEAELRSLIGTSRILPPLLWNPRLVGPDGRLLPTPDGWIHEVAIAVEVDSREHHLSPDDWRRTMGRHNLLAEYGALVLHFPPTQIRASPTEVLRTIESAYLARLRAGNRTTIRARTRAA